MHGMLREPATYFTLSKFMICFKYALIITLLSAFNVKAATLSAARQAFESKDYAIAYTQFQSLQMSDNDSSGEQHSSENSATAAYYLGVMNQQGWGVIADAEKAAAFYQRAAQTGHIKALHNLADLYHRGRGVPQDLALALEFYRRSAALGGAKAAHRLGLIYFQGDGVARDFVRAREWWQQAFDGGETDSGYNLGILHRRGLGTARDQSQALQIWKTAAQQGSGHAQNAYGSALLNAQGIAYNPIRAYAWFRAAAMSGLAVAVTNAELIWESLPPEGRDAALLEAENVQKEISPKVVD